MLYLQFQIDDTRSRFVGPFDSLFDAEDHQHWFGPDDGVIVERLGEGELLSPFDHIDNLRWRGKATQRA